MQRYTVIQPHTSNYPEPIILKKGQNVIYGKEDTQFPNWIFCKSILTNKEGWVPKQYINKPNDKGISEVTQDYSAHELTISESETLLGMKHLNEWTFCKRHNGEYGWIPTSCLSRISD